MWSRTFAVALLAVLGLGGCEAADGRPKFGSGTAAEVDLSATPATVAADGKSVSRLIAHVYDGSRSVRFETTLGSLSADSAGIRNEAAIVTIKSDETGTALVSVFSDRGRAEATVAFTSTTKG